MTIFALARETHTFRLGYIDGRAGRGTHHCPPYALASTKAEWLRGHAAGRADRAQ